MPDNVLITGSKGFLGSAVVKQLMATEKYNVCPLEGKAKWDLTNQKYVNNILSHYQPDVVLHLAARVGGIQANKENPGLFIYENLAMGLNLIESCRKYGKLKKFVMIGTVCSYPKYASIPFKEEDIWNGFPEETNAPYGIAKKTLTQILVAYKQQYNFNCCNLVPVNMYGPHDNFDPKISHVIPAMILKYKKAILNNHQSVEMWGTGNASREFLYVEDCARAIVDSIEIDTSPEPINIGTGQEITIKELANIIGGIMGYTGNIVFNTDFPDGQPRRCLDVSRAEKILNFKAQTPLIQGLVNTVDWFEKNQDKFNDYISCI